MTKSILKITALALLSISLSTLNSAALDATTNTPTGDPGAATPPAKTSKARKSNKLPFHGKLKSVDKVARTITIGTLTLQITSTTIITKAGKPATLDDGVIGETASGSYVKAADGKLKVGKLRFGPKPATNKPAATP